MKKKLNIMFVQREASNNALRKNPFDFFDKSNLVGALITSLF